jgi:hypothetical protein
MLHPVRRVNYPPLAKQAKVGHPHLLPQTFTCHPERSRGTLRLARPTQTRSPPHINQAAVSKMERRADMYISTLQSMIPSHGRTVED